MHFFCGSSFRFLILNFVLTTSVLIASSTYALSRFLWTAMGGRGWRSGMQSRTLSGEWQVRWGWELRTLCCWGDGTTCTLELYTFAAPFMFSNPLFIKSCAITFFIFLPIHDRFFLWSKHYAVMLEATNFAAQLVFSRQAGIGMP